jgi:hypothetical protein
VVCQNVCDRDHREKAEEKLSVLCGFVVPGSNMGRSKQIKMQLIQRTEQELTSAYLPISTGKAKYFPCGFGPQ